MRSYCRSSSYVLPGSAAQFHQQRSQVKGRQCGLDHRHRLRETVAVPARPRWGQRSVMGAERRKMSALLVRPIAAQGRSHPGRQSFDEIDVLILAQIDACRIGARSVGVGAMQVEHTGLVGRDRHRNFFAGGEIGDNCLW